MLVLGFRYGLSLVSVWRTLDRIIHIRWVVTMPCECQSPQEISGGLYLICSEPVQQARQCLYKGRDSMQIISVSGLKLN